jgi:hypothetical protein
VAHVAPDCRRGNTLGNKRSTLTSENDGVSYELGLNLEWRNGRWPTNLSHSATRSNSSHPRGQVQTSDLL